GGCDLLQGYLAQRSSEEVGLENVAQMVARDSGSNGQIPIRATGASIGLVKPPAPVCRQLDDVIGKLKLRFHTRRRWRSFVERQPVAGAEISCLHDLVA